ncbi:oligosaccharide flippase family protein [Bradyrhizobium sp. CCGUVB1N3]|uniref:oligosaccharide flippase family protein n=1 Tax=Bradyrhizobium sp. CCGUVB1N3 TaxID=2949629 RepID=UPI0020B2DF45|nr:oligosaccharide flippase family protein [Bradyrhizobium sp. CCGUVB1N3]MCP3472140.1 oligosaccharide flippase family protein [Bradyrhizobium sp. CCGUVB1N3]
MAVTLVCRIGVGIASLLVLARGLGPANYGFMATVLAYSSIASLVTDFGFGIQALRDIGAQPDRAGELIAACIRVKNLLVATATIIAVGALYSLNLSTELFWASLMLYASIMIMSYGDLAIMTLRGIGRFDVEAYAALVAVAIFVAIVVGIAIVRAEILTLSGALLLARVAQTILSFAVVGRFVKFGNCGFRRLGDSLRFARESSGLAVDTFLTVVPGQLDTIFVSSLLGLHAAGTYQVASRLANYVQLPIQILAQVYMPRLAHSHRNDRDAADKLERHMVLEFSGIGLVLGLAFATLAPIATPVAFGAEYIVPFDVWAAFAVLFCVKSSAAALGVALVARRGVMYRVIGQAVGVTTIILGMLVLLPKYGLVAAPASMVAGTLLTGGIYLGRLILLAHRSRSNDAVKVEA